MGVVANVLVGVVALEHVWFAVLEMLLWQKPLGLKTFGSTPERARETATLAANQGLYNLFLVAGLVWGLAGGSVDVKTFFLACVIVAGVFGGATVNRRIAFVQAIPAALALAAVLAAARG